MHVMTSVESLNDVICVSVIKCEPGQVSVSLDRSVYGVRSMVCVGERQKDK